MGELRRIIDKWVVALIIIVCCFISIIFYQLNRETYYEQNKISTQTVYNYYNQMLKDYYNNLETMDEIHAKVKARAKLYMVYNIEQWNRIKSENEELYNASGYEDKIKHYKESSPEIVSYYEELKQSHQEVLDKYISDSDAINMALEMYDKNFEYVNEYDELINGYIEQGNSMLMTELYSDETSFEHINILKSKHDFRKLLDIDVRPDNSKALDAIVTSGAYINMFILLIVLICVFRYFDDRKNGLDYIIYSASKGRTYLTAIRIFILAFASIISTICVYICVFIVSFRLYGGFEFMDNPLQSYDKYATICFTSNKWFFIIGIVAFSAAAIFITGLIVWLLVSLLGNVSAGMGIAVIILSVSYIMYMGISDKSRLVFLKNINIWNWIIPSDMLTVYKNVGIGMYIISRIRAVFIIEVIFIVLLSISCICVNSLLKHGRKLTIIDRIISRFTTGWQAVISQLPLPVMELYKLLWVKKGIVVALIIVVIISNINIKKGYTYNSDMVISLKYYNEAQGMCLSDELTELVKRYEDEGKYWDEHLKQISIAFANETNEFSNEDLNEALMQTDLYHKGLDEIHRSISNLEYLQKRGITGEVTIPFAVEEMLGEKLYEHQSVYVLLAVIGLIFMIYPIVSEERKQNMLVLIHTAKKGRINWIMTKIGAVVIVTVCMGGIVFISNILNIIETYNINNTNIIIQNYPEFAFIPFKMSLKAYLICNIIWKLILLVAIAGIIVLISTLFGYVLSLVISLALVLPQLLYMLGFDWMYYISPVSTLMIEENWSRGINQINGIILVISGLVCWGIVINKIVKIGH